MPYVSHHLSLDRVVRYHTIIPRQATRYRPARVQAAQIAEAYADRDCIVVATL